MVPLFNAPTQSFGISQVIILHRENIDTIRGYPLGAMQRFGAFRSTSCQDLIEMRHF